MYFSYPRVMATEISVLWPRSCSVTQKNMADMCGDFTMCDWRAHTYKGDKKWIYNYNASVVVG
jgi:hypothetical protein